MDQTTTQSAAPSVRLIYCLTIAGALYASAGMIWSQLPHSSLRFLWPIVGTLWTIAIGLWRLFMVASSSTRLDAPEYGGAIRALRILGIIGLSLSALGFVIRLVYRPILHAIITRPSDDGVEYFVFGLFLQMALAVSPPGILLFELSRLMAFERSQRER